MSVRDPYAPVRPPVAYLDLPLLLTLVCSKPLLHTLSTVTADRIASSRVMHELEALVQLPHTTILVRMPVACTPILMMIYVNIYNCNSLLIDINIRKNRI